MITGAGGEGKSTVLQQITCLLVGSSKNWKVIWHNNPDTPLPVDALLALPQSNSTWLVVADDADLIASDVYEAVKAIREIGREDFQFLLSCRDTDWKASGGESPDRSWGRYTTFVYQPMRGLHFEDAKEIIKAWNRFGERGMGKLSKPTLNIEASARELVAQAVSEKSPKEGAFLGAMLRTRYGTDLKKHVEILLQRLNAIEVESGARS